MHLLLLLCSLLAVASASGPFDPFKVSAAGPASVYKDKKFSYRIRWDANIHADAIHQAAQMITNNTCITYIANGMNVPYIEFRNGASCESDNFGAVHRDDGKWQSAVGITLNKSCTHGPVTPVHELMHTLHILHTQQRPDAPKYVKYPWASNMPWQIPPSFPYYYFGSAMHYRCKAFNSLYDETMGQRVVVPFSDWKILNLHWNCSESCPPLPCKNDGFPHPRKCSTCLCNDFYTGKLCDTPKKVVTLQSSTTINVTLYTPPSEHYKFKFDLSFKDPSTHIHYTPTIAPVGRRIRVTILEYSDYITLTTLCEPAAIEIVDSNLSLSGMRFCKNNSAKGKSFVSAKNVIGIKANTVFNRPLTAIVKFEVV